MLTLPWRKKEEGFQWVEHEKTQIRVRREAREERLSAMGYLMRVCTSLLVLKVRALFEWLLLILTRLRIAIVTWLKESLPVITLSGARSVRNAAQFLWNGIRRLSIGTGKMTAQGASSAAGIAQGGMRGTSRLLNAVATSIVRVSHWAGPRVQTIVKSLAHLTKRSVIAIWNSVWSIGESGRNVTRIITQRIVDQRKIVAYAALTLAVFAGAIGLTSLGIFKQLPASDNITGKARIVDADLIKVGSNELRLFGVDAPEPTQTCSNGKRRRAQWRCGHKAVSELARLVNSKQVTCVRKGTDSLGRIIARCHVGEKDIAAHMVRAGLAWLASGDPGGYSDIAELAKVAGRGIWRAENEAPWNYREERWQLAKSSAPEGCPVKGNISRAGRIYYLPWSNQYDRIRIQADKGERWFCNERDAIKAGWRMTRWP